MSQNIRTGAFLNDVTSEVKHLLNLHSNTVKEKLLTTHKASGAEYIAELFRGNGWTVSIYGDKRKALLLSDPANPEIILLIVRLIINEKELKYSEAREELILFENLLTPVHGCSQFCLIALNGYESKAEKLENFNLLLQDWSYADELIAHYSKEKIKEPRIQLFAHNKQTYKKVRKMMQQHKSVAVVQATGTGKSYLISKLLQDFTGEKRLVMAPSLYVIEQVKKHIQWDKDKIEFMTYAKCMNLSQSEIAVLKPKVIVLDEYHRCGAEEWGRGVENVLNAYPDAFKFGTSATPVRYMDNARDMSTELFSGNIAENLSLPQAIVRNILPMPKYVCALYTLQEETALLRSRIASSRKNEDVKKQLQLELDTFSIDWERSRGIATVLKKYLHKSHTKFIIFCRDENHLLEMEPVVKKWFKESTNDFPQKSYRVYVKESTRDAQLETFKYDTSKDYIHLLFSINMLNEGIHVNDVHGVILLRPTESPNIFYQQIGRCLKVGLNHQPVIFDFVNNFKSIRTHDFLYDLEVARMNYLKERNEDSLQDHCPKFNVIDEVREITELFGEIKFKLDTWEESFGKLKSFKEENGHCIVPHSETGDNFLYSWVTRQRLKCFHGKLDDDRYKRLNDIGVEWNFDQFKYSRDGLWQENFNQLSDFRQRYGHCSVNRTHKEFDTLNAFVARNRHCYKLGILAPSRIDKLNSIGFEWDRKAFFEGRWQQRFDELVDFKNKHGHFKVSPRKQLVLTSWMSLQRKKLKEGKLDPQRKKKLDSIDFNWDPEPGPDVLFERRFEEVKKFWLENGHCKLPTGGSLALCLAYFKGRYKRNQLTNEQLQRLDAIRLDYTTGDDTEAKREKYIKQIEAFIQEYGHAEIARKYKKYADLNTWLIHQRTAYKKGKLPTEFSDRLIKLGVILTQSPFDKSWEEKYEKLKKHIEVYGTFNLPKELKLGQWMVVQRQHFKKGTLSPGKKEKLDVIGFQWNVLDAFWEEQFAALAAFKKEHGHFKIPTKKMKRLSDWCGHIRDAYKKGKLSPERIQRIESLGFIWDATENYWQTKYAELKDFISKHGWDNLMPRFKQGKDLIVWVRTQRYSYKKEKLPEEKIMLLNMININWAPNAGLWEKPYRKLVEFKEKFGHVNVSTYDAEYKSLGSWCTGQRRKYKRNELLPEQIKQLEEIGFQWDGHFERKETWNEFYQMAAAYYKKKGHLRVPVKENKKLSEWLNKQRMRKKEWNMPDGQVAMLDKIGYNWKSNDEVLNEAWMKRYEELKLFKKQSGSCNVPQKHKPNPSLGSWVHKQRTERRKKILSGERIDLLNKLEFDWL
ncbi:MAG: Helicase associated domain protein [Bacteroidia bacterium]